MAPLIFFILTIVFLGFIKSAYTQCDNTFTILILAPLTDFDNQPDTIGYSRLVGTLAAFKEFEETSSSFGFSLEYDIIDTKRDTAHTESELNNYFNTQTPCNLIGIVGAHQSANTINVHNVFAEPKQLPIFSPSSTLVSLSVYDDFPYFFRTIPAGPEPISTATMALMKHYGDTTARIGIIIGTDSGGAALATAWIQAARDFGIPVIGEEGVIRYEPGVTDLDAEFAKLKADFDPNVILTKTNAFEGGASMLAAANAGLSGKAGYQWMGTDLVLSPTSFLVDGVTNELARCGWGNYITAVQSDGEGPVYDQFRVQYAAVQESQYPVLAPVEPNNRGAPSWDAVFALAHSIKALRDQGIPYPSGAQINNYLRTDPTRGFQGAQGYVRYSTEDNDPADIPPFNYFELLSDGTAALRGKYLDGEKAVLLHDQSFEWKRIRVSRVSQAVKSTWVSNGKRGFSMSFSLDRPDNQLKVLAVNVRLHFSREVTLTSKWGVGNLNDVTNTGKHFEFRVFVWQADNGYATFNNAFGLNGYASGSEEIDVTFETFNSRELKQGDNSGDWFGPFNSYAVSKKEELYDSQSCFN